MESTDKVIFPYNLQNHILIHFQEAAMNLEKLLLQPLSQAVTVFWASLKITGPLL